MVSTGRSRESQGRHGSLSLKTRTVAWANQARILQEWQSPNTPEGIAQVVERLQLPLAPALTIEGIPLMVVNPRQMRDFTNATGHLAKPVLSVTEGTDQLDAQALATPITSPSSRLRSGSHSV